MAYDFWETMKKFMKGELKVGSGPNTITIKPTLNPAETVANIQKLAAMKKQAKPQQDTAALKNTAVTKQPVQTKVQGKTGGGVARQNPVLKNIADMVFNQRKQNTGNDLNQPGKTVNFVTTINPMLNSIEKMVSNAGKQNVNNSHVTQGKANISAENPALNYIEDMIFNDNNKTHSSNDKQIYLKLTDSPIGTRNLMNEAVKKYQSQKPKAADTTVKTDIEYEQRLKEAEQAVTNANNALWRGQQIGNSIGYGSTEAMPDLQKLQTDVEKAVANLRNIQAEHPDGNPLEYGLEQFLLNTRTGSRNIESGLFSQIGSINEDTGNLIRGGEPKTIAGHITKSAIKNSVSTEELVNACSDRINELEQKEKVENLPLNEKLELFYLKDFLSQGGESRKKIQDNYKDNQADTQEVERLYTNLPQYQRDIAGTIGKGLGDVMVGAIPVLNGLYTYYSSGGQAAEEAVNKGAKMQDVYRTAGLTGAAKVTLGEILSSLKILDNSFGAGVAESASEALQPFIDRLTYDSKAPLPTLEELTKAFKSGSVAKAFSEVLKKLF